MRKKHTSIVRSQGSKAFCARLVILALLAIAALSPSIALADMYWERITHAGLKLGDKMIDPTLNKEVAYFKANLVKVVNTGTGEWRIFNLDNRMFWAVNPKVRVYVEGSFDDLKKATDMVNKEKARVLADFKLPELGMSDQTRMKTLKLLEAQKIQMSFFGANFTVMDAGKSQLVRGWRAKAMDVMANNMVYERIWVTDEFKPSRTYYKFLEALSFIDKFKYGHYTLIKGFPVLFESAFGELASSTEIIKVEERTIPMTEFLIPINFEKKPYIIPTQ